MTIDELKQLLEEGKITKEQFLAMAKAIDPDYKEEEEKSKDKKDEEAPDIEQLVQSAVDRATNKLGNENKRLRAELERMKKEHMSDEERREADFKEREAAFAERERELTEKENRLYAIKAIKAAGLDDGSDKALQLVEFVLSGDQKEIDSRVKAFGDLVKKFVAAEVDKTFKGAGRTPGKGGSSDTEQNPYTPEHFNLTRQMELEATDPEKAKKLQAAALAAK